ncbi:hypothetical protein PtA15_14A361 [Puccinia triticina]|uniref:Uncharacterized protein n=1 Tax=Puccinia triticina TaxID=208348 RepID=A0ABY7D467_9BASI|nr:uncharacterized protein PtA15_14A361 [Puccinia triticina]WAQ91477.1 hypothetical protein PtA15_14A361 [Puccinia triticina]WAR62292.1 hypothetical protein PtB15_14B387 [Puccinia triticina]
MEILQDIRCANDSTVGGKASHKGDSAEARIPALSNENQDAPASKCFIALTAEVYRSRISTREKPLTTE